MSQFGMGIVTSLYEWECVHIKLSESACLCACMITSLHSVYVCNNNYVCVSVHAYTCMCAVAIYVYHVSISGYL